MVRGYHCGLRDLGGRDCMVKGDFLTALILKMARHNHTRILTRSTDEESL